MNKIVANLPPSYNSVMSTWANVNNDKQTMDNLSSRLFRHELVLKMQGGDTPMEDSVFFTRNSQSQGATSSNPGVSTVSGERFTKAQQREKDEEYVRELKTRTKCFNCGRKGHWSNECSEPDKKKTNQHQSSANLL
jgi:hypothetical protein